jgi:UDP-glucose 4-epimerase
MTASQALIAVTGGAGFIGSHTVDRLLSAGHQVVVIDNFRTGKMENLARWSGDPRLTVVRADVTDGLDAALGEITRDRGPVTRIIHLAAQISVVYSVEHPVEDGRINYEGTVQVLEYARRHGVRKVVFASSAAVYGDVSSLPVREDAPCRPLSPYGINKRASEDQLLYYTAVHGVPTTALRFFNVYGPRQDPASPYTGVISIFAQRAAAAAPLRIFGDGSQTRDFVFVRDVAAAVVRACLEDRGSGVVANVGTGRQTSVAALARLICELCGSSSPIEHAPARAGEVLHSLADVSRLAATFDLRAETPLATGLAETLAWMRGQPG